MRTLIKGGTIVTAEQEYVGDILVEGDVIRTHWSYSCDTAAGKDNFFHISSENIILFIYTNCGLFKITFCGKKFGQKNCSSGCAANCIV